MGEKGVHDVVVMVALLLMGGRERDGASTVRWAGGT